MTVSIQWDNDEHTIIRYKFEQGWGWTDLHTALDEAGKLVGTVEHEVDVIMDISTANLVPQGALSQINRAYRNPKPPNLGITVIIAHNTFLNAMVGMAKKIWGDNANWQLEFVKTDEEGYALIKAHRAKESAKTEEKNVNG